MSKIEWTGESWNPIVGCSLESPGCKNCYAMSMAARLALMGNAPVYEGLTKKAKTGAVWTGKLALSETALLKPLKRKKSQTYFVNSMGDLFHEECPDEWIDRVFATMALSPQHTFQVLTKRAGRMREYFDRCRWHKWAAIGRAMDANRWAKLPKIYGGDRTPMPNVWLGVSVEDQKRADDRIPDLLATPAAVRWISAEPLLGPIDLRCLHHDGITNIDALAGRHGLAFGHECKKLDWIVVGGESGKRARPMHPDWARSLRDQCAATDVPFFFKQWGAWQSILDRDADDPDWRHDAIYRRVKNGERVRTLNLEGGHGFHGERVHVIERVGKKRAGRLLDGAEFNGIPKA